MERVPVFDDGQVQSSQPVTAATGGQEHYSLWKSAVRRSAVRSNASSNFYRTTRENADVNNERRACSHKSNYTGALPCQETCFTLDSHMLTSDFFFVLQTQHDQSQGNTNTTNKESKAKEDNVFPLLVCFVLNRWHCSSVHDMNFWHHSLEPMSQLANSIPGFQ